MFHVFETEQVSHQARTGACRQLRAPESVRAEDECIRGPGLISTNMFTTARCVASHGSQGNELAQHVKLITKQQTLRVAVCEHQTILLGHQIQDSFTMSLAQTHCHDCLME